jgi:catechol 2,3-dioxygenase-like lactoylglutathione lyase family enzyme
MTAIRCLAHIGLTVRNIDRMLSFYTQRLGFQVTERYTYPDSGPGHSAVREAAFLRCNSDHHTLNFFVPKESPQYDSQEQGYGLHHIAFEVFSFEKLLELYRSFRGQEAHKMEARIGGPGNHVRIYLRDPENNLLEFYWNIDKIGWDGLSRPYPPIQTIDLETFDLDAYEASKPRPIAQEGPGGIRE